MYDTGSAEKCLSVDMKLKARECISKNPRTTWDDDFGRHWFNDHHTLNPGQQIFVFNQEEKNCIGRSSFTMISVIRANRPINRMNSFVTPGLIHDMWKSEESGVRLGRIFLQATNVFKNKCREAGMKALTDLSESMERTYWSVFHLRYWYIIRIKQKNEKRPEIKARHWKILVIG